MGVNRRLFNQYFITQDEVPANVKKTIAINEKVLSLSKQMTEQGWNTHRNTFVKFTEWIGVHENSTADYEKNRRWVILPSQELVDYFNRLWELSKALSTYTVHDEVSDILMKIQSPSF